MRMLLEWIFQFEHKCKTMLFKLDWLLLFISDKKWLHWLKFKRMYSRVSSRVLNGFYDYSLSSLEFPNTQVFNVVQNDRQLFTDLQMFYNQTLTFDVFKKSFVSLKVYYPYPQYTLITESPQYTNIGLFSSVGGSLGMFLGFSIFSVLEFVEVLIHIMKILIS